MVQQTNLEINGRVFNVDGDRHTFSFDNQLLLWRILEVIEVDLQFEFEQSDFIRLVSETDVLSAVSLDRPVSIEHQLL